MDTVERDVEQVARAIWKAHNADQGITHGEATEWGPEARAAMAVRDEQIRARLTSEEALTAFRDARAMSGPDPLPECIAALASFVFGPVEPAPIGGSHGADHQARSGHGEVEAMAQEAGGATGQTTNEARPGGEPAPQVAGVHRVTAPPPARANIRRNLTAFAAGRVAPQPADTKHVALSADDSDTTLCGLPRERHKALPASSEVRCIACLQAWVELQWESRKNDPAAIAKANDRAEQAEAEVTRLRAERDAARADREEAFRARDQVSLRLSAEVARLTAAPANERAATMSRSIDAAIKRLAGERDAATREAEALRAEVATCRHIVETAERMREAAVKRADDTLSLLQKAEARVKRLAEQKDNLAYNMSSEREAKEEAESSLDAHRAALDAATRRAEEALGFIVRIGEMVGILVDPTLKHAASVEEAVRQSVTERDAATREAEALRAEVATCRHIVETAERMRAAAVKRAEEAEARAATLRASPVPEDEWPEFPEPQDGDLIDDHMRRVSDHVRDVLALVKARAVR